MNQLNYEAFICEIKNQLQKRMGEDVRIDIHDTVKNNEVSYKGISVLKKGCNFSPNLRLEDFYGIYQQNNNLNLVLDKMVKIFEYDAGKNIDIEEFTDYEKAGRNILFKLVSYQKNSERLKHMPHMRFLDLAVIYYYYIEKGCAAGGNASIQIETSHLKLWGISEIELHKIALENTKKRLPVSLHTMQDVLIDIMGESDICPMEFHKELQDIQRQLPMYILSNTYNYFGAAVLYYPDVLKKISHKLCADFIILPSSIHEVIILPAFGGENYEELNSMIREINESQVADEEILSNHLYYYDRAGEKLLIPSLIL